MMGPFFLRVDVKAMQQTIEFFKAQGFHGHEGVVLWYGRKGLVGWTIKGAVVPIQKTGYGFFEVSLEERRRIRRLVFPPDEYLVQIHTHPEEVFHSHADDTGALIAHVGALSIVVPRFARLWNPEEWAFFRHAGANNWQPMIGWFRPKVWRGK